MDHNLKRDEIRKQVTALGVKNATKWFTTAQMCQMLGLKFKPGRRNMTTPYLVKNLDTGVETRYPSGYKAMKALGMDVGFYYKARTQKPFTVNGVHYVTTKL